MQSDEARGHEALKHFHNYSVKYPSYGLTFDLFLQKVAKYPAILKDSLGMTIRELNMNDSQVEDAMAALAKTAQGRIPKNNSFFQALSNRLENFTFMEAASFVTKESAKDIAKGAQELGNTVISTFKGLGLVLPFLVVGGLVFYVFKKVKNA